MKTIITTVGTSLFENYMREEVEKDLFENNGQNYQSIKDHYKRLRDNTLSANEYNENNTDIKYIKKTIGDFWLNGITKKYKKWAFEDDAPNEYACAEIESILKIYEEQKQDIEVYLLATDTVLSVLSAELIKKWFEYYQDKQITIYFNSQKDVIKNLQIDNTNNFKEGLINLNTKYYLIANSTNDIILNVTGGYKGIIPYLTILGQVNKSQIKYIFENTSILITIPQIPIQLNEELFEKYWEVLAKVENEMLNKKDYYSLIQELESCFEIDNQGNFMLNYLGDALWNKYKSKFFIFYAPDDVWNEIQNQSDIKRIMETVFCYKIQRDAHIVWEDTHQVYKKYSDTKRIYFFEDKQKVFIYKSFEDESDYKKHHNYFKSNQFDEDLKNEIINKSKPRKLKT